jgi:hypothetical protein
MPKAYTDMRDQFMGAGLSRKAAERKAARIYNAKRKPGQAPVTGNDKK